MIDAISLAVDLGLFILTVFVVGQKPTAAKVALLICLVTAIDYGFIAIVAAQASMNPIEWYQASLEQTMSSYGLSPSGQAVEPGSVISVVAGISPAIYVVQSSAYVFIGLGIRWIANIVRKKSEWSAFSQVDLSIWWLTPILLGLVIFIVSLFLSGQASFIVWLVSVNVFMVSAIPLFVQGAAVGKGIMNRIGLGLAMQLVIGILGLMSGMFFILLPVLGLVDFWANFRKLPRDGIDASASTVK